jgi:hypothetical protein
MLLPNGEKLQHPSHRREKNSSPYIVGRLIDLIGIESMTSSIPSLISKLNDCFYEALIALQGSASTESAFFCSQIVPERNNPTRPSALPAATIVFGLLKRDDRAMMPSRCKFSLL